jgi:hypothetical protein
MTESDPGVLRAPASVGQRLLWMLDRYRSGQGALNCPLLCRLRGPLDRTAFQAALDGLVERHETLRTTVSGGGRRLTQLVHPPRPLPVDTVDLTGGPDPAAAAERALAAELATRVDPVRWPVRGTLWTIAEQDFLLCLNIHHLATDAASCPVLFEDLGTLYRRARGEPAELGAPGAPYREFAAWQQRRLDAGELEPHVRYWSRQLAGVRYPRLPGTPGAGPRTSVRETADLPPALVDALRRVARECRTTLFSVLLAVYYLELRRVTGERDLAVASLFANRGRPEFARTVGFLATMLVLRTAVPRTGTVADLLAAVHRTVTGAFRYQELPYQLLPLPPGAPGGPRADDAVFQVIADPVYTARMAELEAEALVPEGIGSRFGMELVLIPAGGGLRAVLFWTAERFPPGFAADFLASYVATAGLVGNAPRMPLMGLVN